MSNHPSTTQKKDPLEVAFATFCKIYNRPATKHHLYGEEFAAYYRNTRQAGVFSAITSAIRDQRISFSGDIVHFN